MDVTVCVGTFGSAEWNDLAQERAVPSAQRLGVPVEHCHGPTLAAARNAALSLVKSEWVIFLDADDELDSGYIEAMDAGTADVRGPVALYIRGARARPWQPRVAGHTHDCTGECLPEGNWLIVGSAVRSEMVRRVGGWRDFDWSEDWDLWLRCYLAGASFELIPDAIYRAHVRPDSRNRGATREARLAAHHAIYAANFPEAVAA